ncbi:hypothetical protein FOZ63_017190, partial [Perkinsus olseni]
MNTIVIPCHDDNIRINTTSCNSITLRDEIQRKGPDPAASNDEKPSSGSAEQACSDELEASAELSAVRELRCELEKSKADEPHKKRKQRFKKLQLKWHPDKNRSDEATAVFQFLQSKKSWYLG